MAGAAAHKPSPRWRAGQAGYSPGVVYPDDGGCDLTGDPRFVVVKPTVIYLTIGAAMMQRDWMDRYIPERAQAYIPDRMVVVWGYVWSGLMFATTAANLVIAVALGHQAWLTFIGVFPLASKLALFAVHYLSFRHVAMRNHRAQEAELAFVGAGEAQAA